MSFFEQSGTPGLTLLFLCVVAALTVALIGVFCALEQSPQVTRLRTALGHRSGTQARQRR